MRRIGLAAVVAVTVFLVGSTAAEAAQPKLTPSRVHLFAEDASVVRDLLKLEDALTYDATALEPSRRPLARRIRSQNQLLIGLCSVVIRDDIRILRAEQELRNAHATRGDVDIEALRKLIADATADVQAKLGVLKKKGDNISLADMFEMQLLMNHLSQLSEMSSSVVTASHSAISAMTRNIKG